MKRNSKAARCRRRAQLHNDLALIHQELAKLALESEDEDDVFVDAAEDETTGPPPPAVTPSPQPPPSGPYGPWEVPSTPPSSLEGRPFAHTSGPGRL